MSAACVLLTVTINCVLYILKSRSTVEEDLLLSTSANEPRMFYFFAVI